MPPQDAVEISFSEYVAAMTTIRLKLEDVTKLAEAFAQQQEVVGLTAAALALMDIKQELAEMLDTTLVRDSDPTPPETREAIRASIAADLNNIQERQNNTSITGIQPDQPTDNQIAAAEVLGHATTCIINADVTEALAEMMEEQDISPHLRWDLFAFAQYIADSLPSDSYLHETFNSPALRIFPHLQHVLADQIGETENSISRTKAKLEQAARTLCRNSGIDEVSDSILNRPGLLRTLSNAADEAKPTFLSIDLHPDHPSFIDGILITHQGRSHAFILGESFPTGFPKELAEHIGRHFLEAIEQQDQLPPDTPWDLYRDKAEHLIRQAQADQHTT